MVSKRFPLFLHESVRSARMQEMPYVMMHHEKKLQREFAVLRFLRGPHGGSGEGSGCLVSVGAGTGQEVWHAEPGNRRVKWHRQRAHATCTRMIWFVLFQFRLSVLIRTVLLHATRIARINYRFFQFSRLLLADQEIVIFVSWIYNELYVKLDYMFIYADYST